MDGKKCTRITNVNFLHADFSFLQLNEYYKLLAINAYETRISGKK
jgi:hypothetical protein